MWLQVDEAWPDGPCRNCRCIATGAGAAPHCDVTSCPAVTSTELFVLQPRPQPFTCCLQPQYVACRHRDTVYSVSRLS